MPPACFHARTIRWPTQKGRKCEHKASIERSGLFSAYDSPLDCHFTAGQYVGLPGKIGNANTKPRSKDRGFFLAKTCHRHVFTQGRYIGLPRKVGNANTKPRSKDWGFFLAKTCHRHVFTQGQYIGLPGKVGNANTKPRWKDRGFFLYFLLV